MPPRGARECHNPMSDFLNQITGSAPLIFSFLLAMTCHEAAHAFVADHLGDATPRLSGRLTLNPLAHLDLLGTIAILFAPIGWAKPVPVNPGNFRNPRWDLLKVGAAGPAVNLLLAAVMAVAFRTLADVRLTGASPSVERAFLFAVLVAQSGVLVNLGLAIFNMIPIPPLDGSKVLAAFLPPRAGMAFDRFEPYGPILLIVLIFSGALGHTLVPVMRAAAMAMVG